MKLLLFDIDGVIVKEWSKGHEAAFREAIKQVYNKEYDIRYSLPGMTDRQIIYAELEPQGLKKKEIELKLKKCMDLMLDVFKNYDNSDLIAIEGIKSLLEKLSKNKNLIVGLLTGNNEGIAYGKMTILGLRDYFKVGGFGTDPHEKRSDLVKVAKEKAEKLGYKIDEIFIIGDTPKDIQTGKESYEKNVKIVALATGRYSVDELKKYNPDYLFENLKDKKILELFNSEESK